MLCAFPYVGMESMNCNLRHLEIERGTIMNLVEDYSLVILVLPREYKSEAYSHTWVIGASTWGGLDWIVIRGGKGHLKLIL